MYERGSKPSDDAISSRPSASKVGDVCLREVAAAAAAAGVGGVRASSPSVRFAMRSPPRLCDRLKSSIASRRRAGHDKLVMLLRSKVELAVPLCLDRPGM